ncbi:MAG: aldo/keto reductase, partial [Planctomycetes bacterium]|nr:aldo/keto reductase [Planctomycetota bacterium]
KLLRLSRYNSVAAAPHPGPLPAEAGRGGSSSHPLEVNHLVRGTALAAVSPLPSLARGEGQGEGSCRLLSGGRAESNQLPYSLLWRAVEFDIQPLCVANEMSILCYSPLAQGLLTGKFQTADEVPLKRARTRHFSASRKMTRHGEPGCERETFEVVAQIRELARQRGVSMGHLSLAWLLRQPAVTSVVVGARNAAQAVENAVAAEVAIDDEVVARLSQITEEVKQIIGRNADPWEHVSRMEKP